jgi:tetratricopeptide (TPR) repeat protein
MTTPSSHDELYAQLMAPNGLTANDVTAALERLAQLIDLAGHTQRQDGIERALTRCTELFQELLTPDQRALLHYFAANAWSHRRQHGRPGHASWEQPELEHEILELRYALRDVHALPAVRRCQILTNLGNALSHVGRHVEAIQHYDRAITLDQRFGMAIGNRAIELKRYAQLAPQPHDRLLLLEHAHAELQRAATLPLDPGASASFSACRRAIEHLIPAQRLQQRHDLTKAPLGTSPEEQAYREWCLTHRLFLHPVNDLGPHALAATDPLSLPAIRVGLEEGPGLLGFFNQLKQEFTSARYTLYTSATRHDVHFADHGVRLANTLDYPSYSLRAEQVKTSFRSAYSLLDKIAFFVNYYLTLGIPEHRVTFRTLWYENTKTKVLRQEVQSLDNYPLRALFWLAKDLHEDESELPMSLEPDARDLATIRHHLEHKYLKLHQADWHGPPPAHDAIERSMADTIAYSLRDEEFRAKALRLFGLTRAALIYLACTVHVHEHHKRNGHSTTHPIMELPAWDDEWKR